MRRPCPFIAALAHTLSTSQAPAQSVCDWRFNQHQAVTGLNAWGLCSTLYDPDGTGPAPLHLVVGGSIISSAGLDPASNIAAYDGTKWSSLGLGVGGGTGNGASVRALTVYNGDLIAAGDFTTAGGLQAARIARWNGTTWLPLGTGLNDYATCVAVHNGELYVGGFFTSAGGTPVGRIARWDGFSWNPLGSGVSGGTTLLRVNAMASHDGFLYVGGDFTNAGGVPVSNLARWNGSAWSVAGDANGTVEAIAVHTPATTLGTLYVSGEFTSVAGVAANYIARLSGSPSQSWSAMGPGLPGGGRRGILVRTTSQFTHEVLASCYASGGRLLRWTGSSWNDFGPTWGLSSPESVNFYNNQYIAVSHTSVSSFDPSYNVWAPLGPGIAGIIQAMAPLGSELFIAGFFDYASNQRHNRVLRWDGTQFLPMAGGLSGGYPSALAVHQNSLYVAGSFTAAGSTFTNSVARWNGAGWDAVGLTAAADVRCLAVHSGDLYLGGGFSNTTSNVHRWTGTSWVPVGNGLVGTTRVVTELETYDGALFAAGAQGLMFSPQSTPLARYDLATNQWVAVPTPSTNTNAVVNDLQVYGGTLYIGGRILAQTAAPTRDLSLLTLTGATGQVQPISHLFVNTIGITSNIVRSLSVYQGQLHVSGTFDRVNGMATEGFVRFDGSTWTPLEGPIEHFGAGSNPPEATALYGGELVFGGSIGAVNGHVSSRWARWSCPPPPPTCYANCDESSAAPVLNVADFGCFLTRYAAGEPYANCDESTTPPVLNVADFGCFLTKCAAGCP